MSKTTVVLVDDHTVVREGLRVLLQSQPDIEVVGEAGNGRESVALTTQTRPDLVIMDVAMPLLNGRDATRQILRAAPQTKVLVLSSYYDDECVNQLMAAGASGYLLKHTAAQELPTAIREVRRGTCFLSPVLARRRRRDAATPGGSEQYFHRPALTPRESEVLHLIAEGFSNQEMAKELGISIKTIEKHRQQVMNKLNLHDIAGLTRFAIAHGFVGRRERAASAPEESEFGT